MGVRLFDQLDLPRAIPLLQTLFPLDSEFNLIELLVIDQSVNGISLAETADRVCAVLIDATYEVIGHTYVKGPADIAGENVDPIGTVFAHSAS